MRTGIKRVRVTRAERKMIIGLYTSGNTNIAEIARAMSRPKTTVYSVLEKAGVHEPKKQTKPRAPKQIILPEPTPVEPGSITLIRGPRRSLWERIKDFFA